jgi:hypothetical protein
LLTTQPVPRSFTSNWLTIEEPRSPLTGPYNVTTGLTENPS